MGCRSFARPTYRENGPLPQEHSAIFTTVIFSFKTTISPSNASGHLTRGVWIGVLCPALTTFKAGLRGGETLEDFSTLE